MINSVIAKTKVKFEAFKKSSFVGSIGVWEEDFTPEQLSFGSKNKFNYNPEFGQNTGESSYEASEPEQFQISLNVFKKEDTVKSQAQLAQKLTFGINPKDEEYIKKRVSALYNLVFKYNGDIHAPNFVEISYGKIQFQGRCSMFDYSYSQFDNLGIPHAAEIKMKFSAEISEEKKRKNNKTSSPDMTHFYTVEEGESLPIISNKIYGRSDLYLELARVNKLNSFRALKVGTQLVLPPLMK